MHSESQLRVLDVGNCGTDHAAIAQLIRKRFDAVVDQAHQATDALSLLNSHDYRLATVNRLLDSDGSPGIDVIAQIRARFPSVPVMMITNFPDHQDAAIAAGAVRGFGKNDLRSNTTVDLLRAYLD